MFSINVNGTFNTIFPVVENMRERKRGQIVLMSSIAGYIAADFAYSASKAAIKTYGEALRAICERDNVGVNVICPGYVRSPMTAHNAEESMMFLMNMEPAIKIIKRGIENNDPVVSFPLPLYLLAWWGSTLPAALKFFVVKKLSPQSTYAAPVGISSLKKLF